MYLTSCHERQHTFESVKALLSQAEVLGAPDLIQPFKLEVDANNADASAVLLQEDTEGINHQICFIYPINLTRTR